MKIIHFLGNEKIEKEIQEEVRFLLTNKIGGYLSLANQPTSRYQGWFVLFEGRLYKFIENIEIVNAPIVNQLRNNFWNVNRTRGHLEESFFLPDYYHSLIYELSRPQVIELTLDTRESYRHPEFGRFYEILREKDLIVIRYHEEGGKEFYLAIKPDILSSRKIGKWLLRNYSLDCQRNSFPCQKYVYQALKLKGKKFVFSVAKDKKEAVRECRFVFKKAVALKQREIKKIARLPSFKKIKDKEIRMAYLGAINSLDSLTVFRDGQLGISAGLPWFFQFWPRDEAISLKALGNIQIKEAKEILLRLMAHLREDGRLLAGPTENADGVGWLFKRIGDFILKREFKRREIKKIKERLEESIDGLLKYHTQDNLAVSGPQETWMDSQERKGARIEIQALRLNMYQLAYQLTKKRKYLRLERQLKDLVRQKFWHQEILADGDNDFTVRPNIFLAAYLYPQLLKKREWLSCFENTSLKLWLDWGGLATIDRTNPLFCNTSTGQDSRSYHNGDSWFYLNNLAALVLYRFGPRRFDCQISKILKASTQEILWQGAIGHHGELSSAQALTSQGCWAQAWSAALYIELINRLLASSANI